MTESNTEDGDRPNTIPLDGFQVVAVPGEGVWVTDGDGRGWHLGTPLSGQAANNKLARAYRRAVGEANES